MLLTHCSLATAVHLRWHRKQGRKWRRLRRTRWPLDAVSGFSQDTCIATKTQGSLTTQIQPRIPPEPHRVNTSYEQKGDWVIIYYLSAHTEALLHSLRAAIIVTAKIIGTLLTVALWDWLLFMPLYAMHAFNSKCVCTHTCMHTHTHTQSKFSNGNWNRKQEVCALSGKGWQE